MVPYLSYATDLDGPSPVLGYMHTPEHIPPSLSSRPFTKCCQTFPNASHTINCMLVSFSPHPDTKHPLKLFTKGPSCLASPIFPDMS